MKTTLAAVFVGAGLLLATRGHWVRTTRLRRNSAPASPSSRNSMKWRSGG